MDGLLFVVDQRISISLEKLELRISRMFLARLLRRSDDLIGRLVQLPTHRQHGHVRLEVARIVRRPGLRGNESVVISFEPCQRFFF